MTAKLGRPKKVESEVKKAKVFICNLNLEQLKLIKSALSTVAAPKKITITNGENSTTIKTELLRKAWSEESPND